MKYTKKQLNTYHDAAKTDNLVVHVKNKQEWDKLKKICPNLNDYRETHPYYLAYGCGLSTTPYYHTIEMEDILWELTAEDLVIGNKYIPHSKTAGVSDLSCSLVWYRAKSIKQPFLYYRWSEGGRHVFSDTMTTSGDYFQPSDVTEYEEEFVLPEYWSIERNFSNYKVINEWMNEHHGIINTMSKLSKCSGFVNNKYVDKASYGLPEITFEQFKKYVLKNQIMEKMIIGYKLVKPEFKNAVRAILTDKSWFDRAFDNISEVGNFGDKDGNLENNEIYREIKDAGVLDLWFEPIYANEYKVGDYIYFIKPFDGKDIGYIAKITEILKNTYCSGVNWINYNGGGFRQGGNGYFSGVDFRKATPEEIEKAQTITLTLGTQNDVITIKKGSIEVNKNTEYDINLLRKAYHHFNYTFDIGHYNLIIPDDIQCLIVGCVDEDHRFSLNEINQIIKAYDKLN